jgi:hypothetical protein
VLTYQPNFFQDHLDFFTSQMTAYQLQQNNILNASIPSSIGQTIPMSAYRQELTGFQPNGLIGQTIPMLPYTQELAGFQPYGPLVVQEVHTFKFSSYKSSNKINICPFVCRAIRQIRCIHIYNTSNML